MTLSDAAGKVTSRGNLDDGELRELMRAYQGGAIEAFDRLHAKLAMPQLPRQALPALGRAC